MNDKNSVSFRSMMGRVRGFGSAKSGAHHWNLMHFTALAIFLLSLYPIMGFFIYAVYGGHAGAVAWLRSPFAAGGVVLFLIAGFHHAASGAQVIIEDYVHCSCAKSASLFIVRFLAAAFAVIGILATLKVTLGV